MPDQLSVALDSRAQTTALVYLAEDDVRIGATLVLAHGAGAAQQSAFMVGFARALAARGIDIVTFNFLYTEQKRRVPDRAPALEACYRAAIDAARQHAPIARNSIFIGGKSMGGRIATHLAAAAGKDRAIRIPDHGSPIPLSGVILLGYPLHPPGKPDQLRASHLPDIRVPMLFVQGERDTFGTPDELRPILDRLETDVTLHVVVRGDHSLAPSRRKEAIAAVYSNVQDVIAGWIRRRSEAYAES
jgi:hypothetical protein